MTFLEIENKVNEATARVDLEKVAVFIQKHNDANDIKSLLKKEFPKMNNNDIEIALEIA